MKNEYFNMICQKAPEGKMIIMAVCPLYKIMDRIGCIGCPMNSKGQRSEFRMYPLHCRAYINTIEKLRTLYGKYLEFDSAEDAFNWWCSGVSKAIYLANKKQLEIQF